METNFLSNPRTTEYFHKRMAEIDKMQLEPETEVQTPSRLRRLVADPALSLLKGAIAVPEAAVGIADIATGGRTGKLAEKVGFKPKEAKSIIDTYYTPEQQQLNREVANTEGFFPTIAAAIQRPSTIAHSVLESAPGMIGAGGVARGIMKLAPKAALTAAGEFAPTVAGAVGEGVFGAGSAAEQIRQESPDGTLSPKQAALAAASGVGTAAFGLAGGGLARKMGIADVDTMIAGGKLAGQSKVGIVKGIAGGMLSEGIFEELPQSAQEQVMQNLALGKPWDERVAESAALGGLAGAAMGGGGQVLSRAGDYLQQRGQQPPAEEINTNSDQGQVTPEDITTANTRTGSVLQDTSNASSDSIPESWPVDPGRDLGIAAVPPASPPVGALTNALAAGGITGIISERRAARGVSTLPANMGVAAVPEPTAEPQHPAVSALATGDTSTLLTSLGYPKIRNADHFETGGVGLTSNGTYTSPQMPPKTAEVLAKNALDAGLAATIEPYVRTVKALDGTLETVPSPKGNVIVKISPYRENTDGVGNILPEVSGVGTSQVDRLGMAVPAMQSQVAGVGSNNIQSGGVSNDLSNVQKEVNGTQTQVPDVRSQAVNKPIDLAVKSKELQELLIDAGYKKSSGGVSTDGIKLVTYVAKQNSLRDWPNTRDQADYDALISAVRAVVNPELPVAPKTVSTKPANTRRQLDTTKDSLTVAVAKLGGVSRAEIDKQSGNGKDLAHTLNSMATKEAKAGILHVISSKGIPLDRMRESLVEQGYLDESADINTLLDKLDSASRGTIHRSTHSTEAGADAYREAEIRYSEMINAMTDEEYDDFSRNQWLDEQVQELADAGDILTEYLDGLDNETMTTADWQEVENDFKEALDATEFSRGNSTEDQGQVQEDVTSEAESVYPVGKGDVASEDTAKRGEFKNKLILVRQQHLAKLRKQAAVEKNPIGKKALEDRVAKMIERTGIEDIVAQNDSEVITGSFLEGQRDFEKGGKRVPPATISSLRQAEWLKGWDSAKTTATANLKNDTAKETSKPSANKIFTEDMAAKARAILKAKLNQLNSGIDPEILQAGITLAGYHIEKGARSFTAFVNTMVEDLGDAVLPYLKSWYMGVKYDPRAVKFDGMTSAGDVESFDINSLKSGIIKPEDQGGGVTNDTTRNGSTSTATLESDQPGSLSGNGDEQGTGSLLGSSSTVNAAGNGHADEGGSDRSGSVASKPRPVHNQDGGTTEGGLQPVIPTPASEPRGLFRSGTNPGNYRIAADTHLGEGTRGQKIDNNLAAIRLIKALDSVNRYPTIEEQHTLARYVGWGGLKSVFDPTSKQPQDQKARLELERLMSKEEYFEARQSVLNAHYTSSDIISSIYKVLDHFGFTGGNVMEPTYGSGNFIGLMPGEQAASSKWYGSELDLVTAKIGQYLYPDAQLLQSGFQDAEFPYGKFDLVIGNPPFGGERITDTNKKRSDISGFKIHNYIIAKSAMHLRPGGVMAMVVTSRFMDTADSEARDYLAKQFKFLSAIRLPNDAFAKNAGTEATTDLVFFQKLMPGENAGEQYKGWLKTDVSMTNAAGEEVTVNNWFAKRPEMMLGEPSMKGTMYGGQWRKEDGKGEFTLNARPGQDTVAELEKVIAGDLLAKHKDIFKPTTAKADAAATSIQMNREDIGVGGYFEENDKLFMREDDDEQGNPTFIELTADTQWTEKQSLGETRLNRIKGMMNLRKLAYSLIGAERFDLSDIEAQRRTLNKAYDAFVEKHGYISETANSSLMAEDVKIESGLESSFKPAITAARAKVLGGKPKKAHAVKASLLKERVYYPQKDIVTAENARDGYNISLSEKGKLDLLYIAGLTKDTVEGVTEKLANEGLIFRDPETGEWIQEDSYLSGNVKAKLARVDGRDGYEKNIEALKRVLPADVPTEKIFVDLGATWVPESVYKAFADYLGISNARVMVLPETGSVKIVSSGTVTTNDVNVLMQNEDFGIAELFNAIANKQSVVAYDPPADRNSSRTVNKERTKALGPIVKRMSATFKDWVMADPMQASLLTKEYNDTQNTHAPRNFNGKYLKTVGASPAVRLRNSQRNAAWRMIQSPVTLLDHVVGAGKTFTVITGIMERKRLGLSNKPMVVVPNHLVGQWAADFLKLYPGANILAATPKDFAAKNRRRLFARIATGNFDAVIVGHSSFGFIPMEPGTQREILMEEISYLERALHQADTAGDKRTVRNIAERIAKKKEKISDLLSRPTDNVITFENMGIDNLTVDESHEFKNLEYSTSMQNITGMGNPKGAKKSFDLYAKIQYLRSKDGAVTFATGTPISNSLVEMYAVLRYLNRPGLKDRKLDVFDSWAKTYALIQPTIEYTASQKLKERQIMNTFDNLTSMLQLYSEFADIISMKDLKRIYAEQIRELNKESGSKESEAFPIPVVKDGGRRLDVGEPTEAQQAYTEYLIARADRLEKLGGKNDPKEDNHLWLMSDARKMALDIRLVDSSAPSDPANKINRSAIEIMRIYHDTNSDKGTQLVFCDLSTPAKGAGKEADKFINGALKVLGLDKDKRFMALLSDISYREKWNMISMKLDVEVLQLNESADTDANAARREKLEEFREKIGDEELSVLLTADSGFSVYDELKRTLIEKGIKENEIAFIHDANTQPQKDELFARVNSGDLRVLIGSSKKMGAGMNAQERLVALHHLDAPWRPSDVEQREGRIIRQGNSLYMVNPDGFKVEIIAYSTSRTFDAVMWQILSRKAGMLDDFRSGADSLTEEATDSAGYAEFMAETTGNPIFKEKFNLEKHIDEVESTHRSILARRKASERIVKNAADLLRQDQRDVDNTKRDLDELKDAASFTVNNEEYADDLTDAYNAALVKFKEDFQQYENVLFPEYQFAVADLDAKLADGRIDDAQYKELKPKKPAAPAKPGLVRLEKTSQSAAAALRISEMLDEIGDRGDVEFSYGAAQIVIAKNTNSVSGGKAGTIDVNYDFEIFINGEQQRELRVTGLKHMSEARLLSLFSTGAIKATIAMAHSNAKYRMERTAKDIATAELTLDKLKMPDVSKLEQMRERYKQITEQVNNLEKDMADKRAQGDNQYIAGDRSRFGAGYEGENKAQFALGDLLTDYPFTGRESSITAKKLNHKELVPSYIAQVSGLMENKGFTVKVIVNKSGHTQMQIYDKSGKYLLSANRSFYDTWIDLSETIGKVERKQGNIVVRTSEGAARALYEIESKYFIDHAQFVKAQLVHQRTVDLFNEFYADGTNKAELGDIVSLVLPIDKSVIIYNQVDSSAMESMHGEAAARIKEYDNEIPEYTDEQLDIISNAVGKTIRYGTGRTTANFARDEIGTSEHSRSIRENERSNRHGGLRSKLSYQAAQSWVNSLPIAKRVKVWQSSEKLKALDPTAYNQIEIAKVDPARVQAMEFNGTIHVITDNVPDLQRVKALVIGHELAHAGQTSKIVDLAVDWFKRTVNGKTEAAKEAHFMLERIADRYGYDLTDEKQYRRAVQEATAAMAEQAVNADWKPAGLMQRLFMYVKHWLRQQGLISHVSDSELSLAVAEMLRIGEKRLSVGNEAFAQADSSPYFSLQDQASSAAAAVTAAVPTVVNHAKENWKQLLNPLDWSHAASWFDNWTPDAIKSGFGYFFNNPFFEGLRDAAKKVFVEEGADRELNRMSLMLQMFGYKPGQEDKRTKTEKLKDFVTKWHSGVGTTEWEKLNLRYLALSKEQQNAMDVVTAQGDLNNTYYSSYRNAMLNRKNQTAKLKEETFNLYKDVYSHMQLVAKIREQQIEQMLLEAGRSKAEVDKTIKDYRKETREVAGWMTRNHGEGNFVTTVHHVVKDLKFTLRDIKDEGQQAYLNYYPGIKVMEEIEKLAALDKSTVTLTGKGAVVITAEKGKMLNSFMQGAEQIIPDLHRKIIAEPARLQKIRDKVAGKGSTTAVLAKIDKRIGAAKEAAKDPRIMVMVYSRRHNVKGLANSHADQVKANLKEYMPEGHRNGEEYITRSSQADTLNEEIFQNMPNDIAMQAGLEKAIEAALKHGEINNDEMDALKSRLIQDTAEVLLGRAAGKYQIRRAPYLIEGYDTANVMSGYQDYITGVAGMLSKAEYASKQFKHLTEASIPVKPWAYKYVFDSLRNMGMADRLSGNARAFVSLWYMGLKPASAIINSTQIYTLGVAEIGRIVGKGESAIARIAKAQKDTLGGTLSMDEKEIFDSAIMQQQEAATALSQITGHNEGGTGKASRILHNVTSKAMALFQNIEVMNRKTIILAAYRVLRDSKLPAGVIDHAALKQALEINNSVNFDQGRHNLPGWARNPLGQTLYALQSFTWNNLNWIYTRATSGEKRDMIALLRYTGMLMLIGGAAALAGGDELDKLYRKLFGKSLLMEAKQWTHKNAKQYGTLGELADAFAWHGAAGMAGFNVSNSMRLQIPVVSQMLGDATMPEAFGGVWAGLARKAWLTTEALTKGDVYRAAESAAPEAIAGGMRAYRQYDRGITTLKGRPVPDENGKPLKYSGLDAVKRVAGFQPLEQSRRMELTMGGKNVVTWWKDERDDLLAELRIAKPGERKEVMPKIMKFNRDVRQSQAWGKVDIISAPTVRNALTFKPNKKDIAFQKRQLD